MGKLAVRFTKSIDEIPVRKPIAGWGYDQGVIAEGPFQAADGFWYLMARSNNWRTSRYYFDKGSITGNFPNEKMRDDYIAMINRAAGETVAVAVAE